MWRGLCFHFYNIIPSCNYIDLINLCISVIHFAKIANTVNTYDSPGWVKHADGNYNMITCFCATLITDTDTDWYHLRLKPLNHKLHLCCIKIPQKTIAFFRFLFLFSFLSFSSPFIFWIVGENIYFNTCLMMIT